MVININHQHIQEILNNVFLVVKNEIDVLHNKNSSNFILIIDLRNLELHEAETLNVESMNEEDAHGVDDFTDNDEV